MENEPVFVELRRQHVLLNKRPQRPALEQLINRTHGSYAQSINRIRRKMYNEAVRSKQQAENEPALFWEENAKIARVQQRDHASFSRELGDYNASAIEQYYRLGDAQKTRAKQSIHIRLFNKKWELLELVRKADTIGEFFDSILLKRTEILLLYQRRALKALQIWNAMK